MTTGNHELGVDADVEVELRPECETHGLASTSYGDWANLSASMQDRSRDVRWSSRCLTARIGTRLAGALPVHHGNVAELPDPYLRAVSSSLPDDARKVLVVGTHADFHGGAVVRRHHDRRVDEAVLMRLAATAARVADEENRSLFAPYLPADQVPGFQLAFGPSAGLRLAEVHSTLELNGATTFDEFIAGRRREERHTLRKDAETLARNGVRAQVTGVSRPLLEQAAGLVADVKHRHGIPDHPRLIVSRIERWLDARPGRAVAFSVTAAGADPAGVCVGKVVGDRLVLHELGLRDTELRHETYVELGFHAPLRFAVEHRLSSIDLGPGHPVAKRTRGARQRVSWHLLRSRRT